VVAAFLSWPAPWELPMDSNQALRTHYQNYFSRMIVPRDDFKNKIATRMEIIPLPSRKTSDSFNAFLAAYFIYS
jgi:hypothetical protein